MIPSSDDGLFAFLCVRPRLLRIARRMLGSPAAGDDVVQDVWVRWQTVDRSVVRNPTAFLVTTTTRLAINVMHSARSRRETGGDAWLLQVADGRADPGSVAQRREGLARGVQVLLDALSPRERAAYVLREAFDYSYRDIARVLRVQTANARQLVTRARQHVKRKGKKRAGSLRHVRLVAAVSVASLTGSLGDLERMLVSDIGQVVPDTACSDGAHDVPAVNCSRAAA